MLARLGPNKPNQAMLGMSYTKKKHVPTVAPFIRLIIHKVWVSKNEKMFLGELIELNY